MTDFVITPPTKLDSTVDTIVHLLVDGSGSMASIASQTRSGINEYFQSIPKSKENSKTLVSLSVFSGGFYASGGCQIAKLRENIDVNDIPQLGQSEYNPNGGTPLLDAIGTTVLETKKLADTSPTPPAVIFVIITDGEENQSRKFTKAQIKELIQTQTDVDKWTFVYMGANQDSFAEASNYGISAGNTVNFAAGAVDDAFATASTMTSSYATSNSAMRSVSKFSKYKSANTFAEAGLDNTKTIDK